MAALAGIGILGGVALWWMLARGPIPIDMATPWLKSAIVENFGNQFHVDIGGTVLERDEHGRAAIRIRDVVVRDLAGAVIASTPKAEVGFSTGSLLGGHPRAESLNLVGAELAVRVEADGSISVSTGNEQRALATTPSLAVVDAGKAGALPAGMERMGDGKRTLQENFAAALAWLDSLSALGLDGGDLTEVGLKSGNLVVDDRRNGRQSRFENIHFSVTRPRAGVLEVQLGSEDADRPWRLTASVRPGASGLRSVELEAEKLLLKDVLLAMRVDGGRLDAEAPISGTLRADIGADGMPQYATGRINIGAGAFSDAGSPNARLAIDRAEVSLEWNGPQRSLTMPFQIVAGGTRMTSTMRAEAPRDASGSWAVNLGGGSIVLAPVDAGSDPLALNHVLMRGSLDPVAGRFNIEQAEVSGKGVSVAMSGGIDFSVPDPRLAIGLAARHLSSSNFKQLWPPFINPAVRTFVFERVAHGTLEEGEIATNAPISTITPGGPPIPDDGLSLQISTSGTSVKPFDGLPEIHDADLVVRIKGRYATVTLGRGGIDLSSGRRLTLANGVFEVPDTDVPSPPAKVRVRVDGPVAAAAELLTADRLKDAAAIPIDPATSRGNILGTINLGMPLGKEVKAETLTYAISADIANFAADKFLASQKVEAQILRATANNRGYQIKGDMRIGGVMPASVDLRHTNGDADAELRLTGTLDDTARARFSLDPSGTVAGPIPIKVTGRVALGNDQDSRLAIEADFTQTRIDQVIPGWTKPANRSARATMNYVGRGKALHFEDVAFDGGGASLRGTIDFDANGDFAAAVFPVFGLGEGDRANLKLERTPDNVYKVTLRGDAIDGRSFVHSSLSGSGEPRAKRSPGFDFDLDAKVGSVFGYKGEALRSFDMRLGRRAGIIRNLALNARFAGDGTLTGELRGRPGERQIVYLEFHRCRRAFPFHRHLFPDAGRANVDRNGPAHARGRPPGRLAGRARLLRQGRVRSRQCGRQRAQLQQRRPVLAHARRVYACTRENVDP